MRTENLQGDNLNLAVNVAQRLYGVLAPVNYCHKYELGMPIIEGNNIATLPMVNGRWRASWRKPGTEIFAVGDTLLEAGLRCYVCVTIGEECDFIERAT